MGNKQSESKLSQKEVAKCQDKVDSLEELLTHYSDCDTNNMELRQTNLGIFSVGVENSSNESCNCNCSGFWGILEILATIGLTILMGFIIFRCLAAYGTECKVIKAQKEQRMVEMLEERVNRDHTNKNTAIEMHNDGSCS